MAKYISVVARGASDERFPPVPDGLEDQETR